MLRSIHLSDRAWIGGIHHHADAAHARNQLRKRSQQLGAKIGRDVAAARGEGVAQATMTSTLLCKTSEIGRVLVRTSPSASVRQWTGSSLRSSRRRRGDRMRRREFITRGRIEIINRKGLKAVACECYEVVSRTLDQFLEDKSVHVIDAGTDLRDGTSIASTRPPPPGQEVSSNKAKGERDKGD